MSKSEKKVADITGKFIHPLIRGSTQRKDASWTNGRIILSNKNIWLITSDKKQKIPLESLKKIGESFDLNQSIVRTTNYVSLVYEREGERRVSLVSSSNDDSLSEIRDSLYNVLLNGTIVYLKHPVKRGGVIQDTADWQKAQTALSSESVRFATEDGDIIKVELDEVQNIEAEEKTVKGDRRKVLVVDHAESDGTTVVSHIYAPPREISALKGFIGAEFEEEVESDIELSDRDRQVLTALYSGVSPFDIPDFIGADVDEVEDIYEELIELGVLNEVRKRREVTLTTRGRNLASKSIGED